MALFDNDLSQYRPRFVDMRIAPGVSARMKEHKRCSHTGCDMIAQCKVARRICRPGVTGAEGRLFDWFCQQHAAYHNKRYNFFDTLSDAQAASFRDAERTGHQPSWKFTTASSVHLSNRKWKTTWTSTTPKTAKPHRSRLQLKSLDALSLPSDATPDQVRERYAHLVKICHPDSNGGDRSMEERLNRVIKAFKILRNAKLA